MKTNKGLLAKLLCLVLTVSLCMALMTACGSGGSDYADTKFIKSVGKSLEARWKITDVEYADKEITVQGMTDAIQAELDVLSEYENASFEDTKLQEKALKYINILKDSKENVNWLFSDDFEEMDSWQEMYNERTILLKDFADNYGLTVSSKWQDTLDEILADGKTAEDSNAQKDALTSLVNSLEFKKTKDDYGWITYEAVLDNTSDYDIESLALDINLLDADGVIIESTYANAQNVKKGQKSKMTFETDKQFDRYEIQIDYYEVK